MAVVPTTVHSAATLWEFYGNLAD